MSDRSIGEEGTRYGGGSGFIEEPAGTRIGDRYEIAALLGRGGMGAVYRCHDPRLGRLVALKRILAEGMGGAAGLERFRREAQAVASLNHRNIVTVHELAEDVTGPYLVMELLEGADFGSVIATRGALPVAEVVDIATQVGGALSYAHRRGVVHRDIKPSNLFRLRDGTVKILDFGLARVGSDSQLSQAGFGLGTLDYVSPEQRRDASRVDHRSDLFSLGATLYHLATGKAPRLVRERDLPDELRDVVLALMEDRPEDRPFSVEEALALLPDRERVAAPVATPPWSVSAPAPHFSHTASAPAAEAVGETPVPIATEALAPSADEAMVVPPDPPPADAPDLGTEAAGDVLDLGDVPDAHEVVTRTPTVRWAMFGGAVAGFIVLVFAGQAITRYQMDRESQRLLEQKAREELDRRDFRPLDLVEAADVLKQARTMTIFGATGKSVEDSQGQAAELFGRACDLGNGEACGELASRYAEGRGVPQDASKAGELRWKACVLGRAVSCDASRK